jgi:hypothetical protein
MLIVLVLALAALSTYTLMQPTGLDFLRVSAFKIGATNIKVVDMLTGLGILGVIAASRGPLAVASGAMFVLWLMTLFGLNRLFGLDVSPLIVYVIVVGGVVQVVTHKSN